LRLPQASFINYDRNTISYNGINESRERK